MIEGGCAGEAVLLICHIPDGTPKTKFKNLDDFLSL